MPRVGKGKPWAWGRKGNTAYQYSLTCNEAQLHASTAPVIQTPCILNTI
uniref:Uncharacterized protein n=1 Tax=Anguilla anguilla TaxID=7936 RepID=A0A0E9RPH7_ANGAN